MRPKVDERGRCSRAMTSKSSKSWMLRFIEQIREVTHRLALNPESEILLKRAVGYRKILYDQKN